jgi:asparagine synthase (glutamine-hydrolysing)
MCGLAGMIDLCGQRTPDEAVVARMTDRVLHRGPDDDGGLWLPGIGLGHRRLSLVGLSDGRQAIWNEDHTVAVVFNGELFNHHAVRKTLEARGHIFGTSTDTELLVHLYEEHGEDFLLQLEGQFAFVLVDQRKRVVLMARDRVGICPLHWARRGDWLFVASEIKSLTVSGAVTPVCDPKGLDHMFTFFAMATRRTMFEGVQSVLPGHCLRIAFNADGRPADIVERRYWDLDFPDHGDEYDPPNASGLIDEFEGLFQRAVELRLRADVPVVGYLSGGVDSAYVVATASRLRGEPLPSFTIKVPGKQYDETPRALEAARYIGSSSTVLECGTDVIADSMAALVTAADCPVIDTSCAALWCLAREVHSQGYKAVLTGEGADEAFAGYVWFKYHALRGWMDVAGFRPNLFASRISRKVTTPHMTMAEIDRIDGMIGGPHAQSELYNLFSIGRHLYYSNSLKERLGSWVAYEDLPLDLERMRRWHPLNRSLYVGYKTLLAGMLLNHKGDRIAMANSVETRYPFLDERLIEFASKLHPRFKLRGVRYDKWLLRQAAARVLPTDIALRPKAMFRAPFANSFFTAPSPFVHDLLSTESLNKTGYFDPVKVHRDLALLAAGRQGPRKTFVIMALTGVITTQLWHHINLGGGLCDLPSAGPTPAVSRFNPSLLAA